MRYARMLEDVVRLIDAARTRVATAANAAMTASYWDIGRSVVDHEHHGPRRAAYGTGLLERLSADLTRRFGRGFSVDNLETARLFYLAFPERTISGTASRKSIAPSRALAKSGTPSRNSAERFPLAWSHYALLVRRVARPEARAFYEAEALRGGWTVRQLERQVASQFFERTALSRKKPSVRALPSDAMTPEDQIKDPFVLEFLALKDEYSENDLEQALIGSLETFLLELGGDFTFIGRQRRLRIGSQWYRVDLLLFHRRLRCLVVIDLKLGHFTHSDAGQMHLYLNYARENWMLDGENPPIGLILCTSKDDAVVRYALDGLSNKVLATEYRTALPAERTLAAALKKSRRYLTSRNSFSSAAWSPRANASSASSESRSR